MTTPDKPPVRPMTARRRVIFGVLVILALLALREAIRHLTGSH